MIQFLLVPHMAENKIPYNIGSEFSLISHNKCKVQPRLSWLEMLHIFKHVTANDLHTTHCSQTFNESQ